MPSTFEAQDAANYDRLMGRWSRRLAPLFLQHAGFADGESVLEVGCGTGSLTFALAAAANLKTLMAIDYADVYVAAAQAQNRAPNVFIERGDACELRFPGASFDRCLSLLVLHFIPEPERAVAEMRRVSRPGGTVAAAVWDVGGGMPGHRIFWDTAAVLDETAESARARAFSKPIVGPGGLARLWRDGGLSDVDEQSLTIRMDYADFADYWAPLLGGEGPLGAFLATLAPERRLLLERHVRAAYLAGCEDGARSFTATARSVRGTVPV